MNSKLDSSKCNLATQAKAPGFKSKVVYSMMLDNFSDPNVSCLSFTELDSAFKAQSPACTTMKRLPIVEAANTGRRCSLEIEENQQRTELQGLSSKSGSQKFGTTSSGLSKSVNFQSVVEFRSAMRGFSMRLGPSV